MELALISPEPADEVVVLVLSELVNQLRQAASLVEVNIAAGIAHEALLLLG